MFELRPYRKQQSSYLYPFPDMEEMERRLFGAGLIDRRDLGVLKTDITDEGDHYALKADLPGFKKEDIRLELNDELLTVHAERHSEHEEKDKQGKYVCMERSYGSYSRSFDVSGIDVDKIDASYHSGVLALTLPKRAETQPALRQIPIN